MIQPIRLINRFVCQYQPKYQFSKILKMKPIGKAPIEQKKLAQSIANATQFFRSTATFTIPDYSVKIPLTEAQTFQQFITLITNINIQAFEKLIFSKYNQIQMQTIIQQLNKFDVINSTIELLISQPQYTHRLKNFLTNFINCILIIFRKEILFVKSKNPDLHLFKKCSCFINEYIILVDLSDKLAINFCLFMTYIKQTNSLDSSRAFFSNQKIIVDYILQRKEKFNLSKKDFSIMIGYIASTSVGQNYPTKYNALIQFLYSALNHSWYCDADYNVNKLIVNFEKLRFDCEKITNGMKQLIRQELTYDNFGIVVSAINELIKLKAKIYYQQPIPQDYVLVLNKITNFLIQYQHPKQDAKKNGTKHTLTKQVPRYLVQQIPKYLIPTLYRSSIWLEDIWLYFADWIQKQNNYKKLYVIDLYNIFQLMEIDKEVIPKNIIDRFEKTKQFMLTKKNFRIEDVNLIKEYHMQFGDRMGSHYTIQQQICNNLRSVSKKKVTAEVLVRMFIVDIMVNDKVIIEINGFSHYIDNQRRQKVPNLKGAFKKRILQKLGYKLLEYQVATIVDGNIELLQTINSDIDKAMAS